MNRFSEDRFATFKGRDGAERKIHIWEPEAPPAAETFVLTASIKPFINFVWGGTIVMVLGFFLSLVARYRRIKIKSRKNQIVNSNNNENKKNDSNGHETNGKHKHKSEEVEKIEEDI